MARKSKDAAVGSGGDARKVAEASRQSSKAEAAQTAGDAGRAIDAAKDAWQKATDAVKKL
ncbi:MAG: hypothetical protein U1G08_13905 [Verrucomicrobiota bacterium]